MLASETWTTFGSGILGSLPSCATLWSSMWKGRSWIDREEWERRAQVCYTWVRRLLAADAINRESSGSVDTVDLEQLERALGERLDALDPAPRAELLHIDASRLR